MRTVFARLRRVMAAAGMGLALVIVGGAAPATAHQATWGWYANHEICKFSGCVRNGNLVRMWQTILYVDGRFNSVSNIDGQFGPNTHNWTVQWQDRHMDNDLSGRVGRNTWDRAWTMLEKYECVPETGEALAVYRNPALGRLQMFFMDCTTGLWRWVDPSTGRWADTSH